MRRASLLALVLLVALLVAAGQVQALSQQLGWDYTQGTTPAVGFNLYRAATCTGPFTKVNPTLLPLTPLLYTDSGLVEGQTYCWKVVAVDAGGGESGPSNLLAFQVHLPPSNPTNLRAVGPPTP